MQIEITFYSHVVKKTIYSRDWAHYENIILKEILDFGNVIRHIQLEIGSSMIKPEMSDKIMFTV